VVYADAVKYQRYESRLSLDQIVMKRIDETRENSKSVMLAEKQGGEEQYIKHCQLQDDP
jgi:hypothetical protein